MGGGGTLASALPSADTRENKQEIPAAARDGCVIRTLGKKTSRNWRHTSLNETVQRKLRWEARAVKKSGKRGGTRSEIFTWGQRDVRKTAAC